MSKIVYCVMVEGCFDTLPCLEHIFTDKERAERCAKECTQGSDVAYVVEEDMD